MSRVSFVGRAAAELDAFLSAESDPAGSPEQAVDRLIHRAGLLSAALHLLPIPFSDMVTQTPIQMVMVVGIGRRMGFPEESLQPKALLSELAAVLGWRFVGRQGLLALLKVGLPIGGAILSLPMVYGWTVALGKLTERYFRARGEGRSYDASLRDELKNVFHSAMEKARQDAEAEGFSRAARNAAEALKHASWAQAAGSSPTSAPPAEEVTSDNPVQADAAATSPASTPESAAPAQELPRALDAQDVSSAAPTESPELTMPPTATTPAMATDVPTETATATPTETMTETPTETMTETPTETSALDAAGRPSGEGEGASRTPVLSAVGSTPGAADVALAQGEAEASEPLAEVASLENSSGSALIEGSTSPSVEPVLGSGADVARVVSDAASEPVSDAASEPVSDAASESVADAVGPSTRVQQVEAAPADLSSVPSPVAPEDSGAQVSAAPVLPARSEPARSEPARSEDVSSVVAEPAESTRVSRVSGVSGSAQGAAEGVKPVQPVSLFALASGIPRSEAAQGADSASTRRPAHVSRASKSASAQLPKDPSAAREAKEKEVSAKPPVPTPVIVRKAATLVAPQVEAPPAPSESSVKPVVEVARDDARREAGIRFQPSAAAEALFRKIEAAPVNATRASLETLFPGLAGKAPVVVPDPPMAPKPAARAVPEATKVGVESDGANDMASAPAAAPEQGVPLVVERVTEREEVRVVSAAPATSSAPATSAGSERAAPAVGGSSSHEEAVVVSAEPPSAVFEAPVSPSEPAPVRAQASVVDRLSAPEPLDMFRPDMLPTSVEDLIDAIQPMLGDALPEPPKPGQGTGLEARPRGPVESQSAEPAGMRPRRGFQPREDVSDRPARGFDRRWDRRDEPRPRDVRYIDSRPADGRRGEGPDSGPSRAPSSRPAWSEDSFEIGFGSGSLGQPATDDGGRARPFDRDANRFQDGRRDGNRREESWRDDRPRDDRPRDDRFRSDRFRDDRPRDDRPRDDRFRDDRPRDDRPRDDRFRDDRPRDDRFRDDRFRPRREGPSDVGGDSPWSRTGARSGRSDEGLGADIPELTSTVPVASPFETLSAAGAKPVQSLEERRAALAALQATRTPSAAGAGVAEKGVRSESAAPPTVAPPAVGVELAAAQAPRTPQATPDQSSADVSSARAGSPATQPARHATREEPSAASGAQVSTAQVSTAQVSTAQASLEPRREEPALVASASSDAEPVLRRKRGRPARNANAEGASAGGASASGASAGGASASGASAQNVGGKGPKQGRAGYSAQTGIASVSEVSSGVGSRGQKQGGSDRSDTPAARAQAQVEHPGRGRRSAASQESSATLGAERSVPQGDRGAVAAPASSVEGPRRRGRPRKQVAEASAVSSVPQAEKLGPATGSPESSRPVDPSAGDSRQLSLPVGRRMRPARPFPGGTPSSTMPLPEAPEPPPAGGAEGKRRQGRRATVAEVTRPAPAFKEGATGGSVSPRSQKGGGPSASQPARRGKGPRNTADSTGDDPSKPTSES